jgi:hypothetical protein
MGAIAAVAGSMLNANLTYITVFQANEVLTFFLLITMTILHMWALDLPVCWNRAVCSTHIQELLGAS